MPKPTVGRTVLVTGGPANSNGTHIAPGVITRVWADSLINVTVFPDGSNQPRALTSVTLHRDEEAAVQAAQDAGTDTVPYAFWPTIS